MYKKPIKCIRNNNVIKIYTCTKDASIDGFNPSLIRAVCIGQRKSHKGYQWQYVNVDDIKQKTGISKTIIYKKDGQQIMFKNKKELSKFLGITVQEISNILLGRKKQSNNYEIIYG